jgi:NADPH:quinone reductase-like Zn-dependent oxidoreductase
MTAVVHERYGTDPAAVLGMATVPRPRPTPEQVLVRVHAASVDRGTWHVMAGLPYPVRLAGFGMRRPKHLNPGRSLAGTVEEVGSAVRAFSVGDEVYGVGVGSFAQYVCARPDKLAIKPANLTFAQAAAVPISGLTALQAIRVHGHVEPGQHVLVIGAAGGVGSFAVQIAKSFGAIVTGVCGPHNTEHVAALGADHVIDYTTTDFAAADQRTRYDVILDTGGNSSLRRLRRVLTRDGVLVIVGGETDGRLLGGMGRSLRAAMLSPLVRQKLGTFVASENAADLVVLAMLIEAGEVRPAVDRSYPLSETAAAITHLVHGGTRGKTVITV